MEQLGIDAPLHEKYRPPGTFTQHSDQFGIGSEQNLPQAIEGKAGAQRLGFT